MNTERVSLPIGISLLRGCAIPRLQQLQCVILVGGTALVKTDQRGGLGIRLDGRRPFSGLMSPTQDARQTRQTACCSRQERECRTNEPRARHTKLGVSQILRGVYR